MPAERLTVGVTGGRKLQRYLTDAIKGKRIEDVARDFVQLFPLGALRAAVPRRSGRLAHSLRLEVHGSAVMLTGIFYAPFEPVRTIVEEAFFGLARETLKRLIARGGRA